MESLTFSPPADLSHYVEQEVRDQISTMTRSVTASAGIPEYFSAAVVQRYAVIDDMSSGASPVAIAQRLRSIFDSPDRRYLVGHDATASELLGWLVDGMDEAIMRWACERDLIRLT